MDTINTIELKDELVYPDDDILKSVLEDSYEAYCKVQRLFEENDMHHEWRYYKDGKAWLCKVQKKKKTIVWMSAWKGYMQAGIYVPERLMDNVYALDISDDIKEKIRNTKNVGKSKPCIFEIRNSDILEDFNKVMQFKITAK
jgi:hypothetical protein